MGKTFESKDLVISLFPGLATDCHFKITSPHDESYNCIAWAYFINNKWMWPNTGDNNFFDGTHFWPTNEIITEEVCHFIDAFKLQGYEICNNWEKEKGFRRIALYVEKGTNICTHASRELSSGIWVSKLGKLVDIEHGNPYTIEGDRYGEVYCIMKKLIL